VKAIDRKLTRDLWSLRGQVVSIALVIACGIAAFTGTFATHASLAFSRDLYYDTARFPHVFAVATRAPSWLLERVRAIRGVAEAEVRVVQDSQLAIAGVDPPMTARLIGQDFASPPGMNRLTLTAGRWPSPGAGHEVVVNQRFVEARKLPLGAQLRVLMNGKREVLTLVGTVLSPEYIYPTRGTGMPDDEWFAILWIDARTLAAALDMVGAFDSLVARLEPGARPEAVIAAIDQLLEPYGGRGAVGRDEQMSHKILSQEIDQQRVFGTVLPAIFLAVAAFILNVVLHRQVNAQRGEIAALKALGYGSREIALHYLKFASAIVVLGAILGVALGTWLGRALTGLYTDFFHFPEFHFVLPAWILAGALAAALAAAFGGALAATRGVVRLRTAEAMRPPAPERFRPLVLERLGLASALTPAQRMVMRNLERHPLRALAAITGIAGSVAILISGTFWTDSVDWFMELEFSHAQRGDVQVAFVNPVARAGAAAGLARLPGVSEVAVSRSIAARLEAGHRSYRTAVTGVPDDARLLRIVDSGLRVFQPAPGTMLLGERLARRLGVSPGDTLRVVFLEGKRREQAVLVGGTVHDLVGMNAWMRLEDLNRLAADGDLASGGQLRLARDGAPALLAALKEVPAVAVVIESRALVESFRANNARNLLFFTAVLTAFAATIAVGVVYNNARIQLAERAWELASLRVLGFTRREVSVLLLAELAIEVAAAIPLGLAAGLGLAILLVTLMPMETMELPMVILPRTYLYAAAVVVAAGVASALVVRARIDRLDLVAVLKTRE
jgi:putative ABC transport system permease protein